ncbi:MAG: hypothetical protein JKY34_05630 [Kordiimonadaceae bacterium]|nr:hypothetical protein [Kordiimonadaceae bacterium]
MRQLFILWCLILMPFQNLKADMDRMSEGDVILGEKFSFESKILSETQHYMVILPRSYETETSAQYNVIYVLDGHLPATMIARTAMEANYGWGSLVPNSIIIGIPSNNRIRDYSPVHSSVGFDGKNADWLTDSGGGKTYRAFLRTEFIPHIESHYRSNGHRTLIGHSLGGLLAINDFLSKDRLFQAYVSADPSMWFADTYLIKQLAKIPEGSLDNAGNLYISNALKGSDTGHGATIKNNREKKEQFLKFLGLVEAQSSGKTSIKMQHFPNETHGSVLLTSVQEGLRHAFTGYAPPDYMEVARNPSLIVEHYRAFSKRIGGTFLPEERDVIEAARIALSEDMTDNALELHLINVGNHPESALAWWKLGEYHEKTENKDKALAAFSRVLTLMPDDSEVKEKVESFSR